MQARARPCKEACAYCKLACGYCKQACTYCKEACAYCEDAPAREPVVSWTVAASTQLRAGPAGVLGVRHVEREAHKAGQPLEQRRGPVGHAAKLLPVLRCVQRKRLARRGGGEAGCVDAQGEGAPTVGWGCPGS
jgi:hypothetical protein